MPHSGKSLLGALSAPVYWLYRLWCRSLRYTEINRAAIENTTDQAVPWSCRCGMTNSFP